MKCRRRNRARPSRAGHLSRMTPVELATLAARLPAPPAHPFRAQPYRISPSRPRGQRRLDLGPRPCARWAGAAPARGSRPRTLPARSTRPRCSRISSGLGSSPTSARPPSSGPARSTYRQSDAGAVYEAALDAARLARPRLRLRLLQEGSGARRAATSSTRRRRYAGRCRGRGAGPGPGEGSGSGSIPGVERFEDARLGRAGAGPVGAVRRPAAARPARPAGPTSSPWWSTISGTRWIW